MSQEHHTVKALFDKLVGSPLQRFPSHRGRMDAPDQQGVYVIYDPEGRVLHVGRTPRGRNGLRQRLNNHLHNQSSFTTKYLKGDGAILRNGCTYRYLVVEDPRSRALLESYAVGCLCPAHVGLGEDVPASVAPA